MPEATGNQPPLLRRGVRSASCLRSRKFPLAPVRKEGLGGAAANRGCRLLGCFFPHSSQKRTHLLFLLRQLSPLRGQHLCDFRKWQVWVLGPQLAFLFI